MRVLLDTHLLIWVISSSNQLSVRAKTIINDESVEVLFSSASVWEVSIKYAQGRADFPIEPLRFVERLRKSGYEELSIRSEHAIAVSELPSIHNDPFDRIIISQASVEAILLLTADRVVATYPGLIQRV